MKGLVLTPEEAAKIKCDRCRATCGLMQHDYGWRCPTCIWTEREKLIEVARCILSAADYISNDKPVVIVSRYTMDKLKEAVQYATLADKEGG